VPKQLVVAMPSYYFTSNTCSAVFPAFFEVIHWCSPHQNNYQLICWGGACKGHILYMDGTSLTTRVGCTIIVREELGVKLLLLPYFI